MIFARLSEYFQKLERTPSRLKMMAILADLFREALAKEVDKICYLALGQLGPKYVGVEFQLADKMMIRVLSKAFGVKEVGVIEEYKKRGDLGEVGEKLNPLAGGQNSKLSVLEVYNQLVEIAKEVGEGSVERKIKKMAELLNGLESLSVRYVVRIPLGKLRLGFSDMTMIDGLSYMITGDKSLAEEIRRVYEVRADIGQIAQKLKIKNEKLKITVKDSKLRGKKIIQNLRTIRPLPGLPVMPELCQRLGTAEEMIEKVGVAKLVAVEPKFDGTRLQIHVGDEGDGGRRGVRIFTRNLENVTHMFPEIVEAVKEIKGVKEVKRVGLILDGEAVGVELKTGLFLPFQETIKRKRKHGIQEALLRIPVVYFAFDILYWGGKSLLAEPFSERRRLLERVIGSKGEVIKITPQKLVDSPDELRRIHNEYVAQGLEGAVVKNLQSGYEPGRRGFTWVKFKHEETKKGGGLADTVDCLVMGYYKGRGKWAKFGIGRILLGVRDNKDPNIFLTVSKVGSGVSDEEWPKLKHRCDRLKTKVQPKEYQVDKNLTPDVWCIPGIVVEIKADNITKSPVHTAGLSLRFPRLKRFRDDKGAEEVTTIGEVGRLYRLQFN